MQEARRQAFRERYGRRRASSGDRNPSPARVEFMTESVPTAGSSKPDGATALARSGPKFAALTGLTSLAILLEGVFAGEFIDHGAHGGWLNAHDVNGYVVVGLAAGTAA